MEPIGHEGLGRLLDLGENLSTPHIVFSHSDLTEATDLESGGSIKIGKSFDLPPKPLGLDSDKEPYLHLSENIAVLDNASSLRPQKIVEIASKFREEAGYSRLVYAPAVEPSEMPILWNDAAIEPVRSEAFFDMARQESEGVWNVEGN